MKKNKSLLLLFVLLSFSKVSLAHEGYEHRPLSETVRCVHDSIHHKISGGKDEHNSFMNILDNCAHYYPELIDDN